MTLLTERISEFEKRNIKLLSIASDSVRLLRQFKEENKFKVDIISDRGAIISKQYGVCPWGWVENKYQTSRPE